MERVLAGACSVGGWENSALGEGGESGERVNEAGDSEQERGPGPGRILPWN